MANKLTPESNLRWESTRWVLPEHREMWLNRQEKAKRIRKPTLDEVTGVFLDLLKYIRQ
ncbi:YolD-like family protein [Alteribacillus bidgolensis]|uniref:Uncharacterized protein n=1 Tax=Alteribacillus bidgolensis TaxID=930129 RepID=A0A1G8QPW3_9BACI|nr:YolD-like family protein [Alteribacillus bidgolensis]SDJ06150.1 hypothetical protein SAMN05216352_1216 [Alteribacillus bidgolensis]